MVDINDYNETRVCDYKGRRYHVRDNGAVYREAKPGSSPSKLDEKWTFGKIDHRTGYMLIGSERVHRIVCVAFQGEPVGDRNVADHKDTNRCNNRPENLHWVTRLENTLNNPITRAKVELICGSIENFLKDPTLLYGHEADNPNFVWMKSVTKEEAERSLKRLSEWAAKPIEERLPKGEGMGEWIFEENAERLPNRYPERRRYYGPYRSWAEHKAAIEAENQRIWEEEHGLKDSLTPGAKQLNWKTPTEFLLCPTLEEERTLEYYLKKLVKGSLFSRTKYDDGGEVYEAGINTEENALYVLTDNTTPIKPWALAKITLLDGYFVHENKGSFFEEAGGQKYFTLAMGKEWAGGDVIDDYC